MEMNKINVDEKRSRGTTPVIGRKDNQMKNGDPGKNSDSDDRPIDSNVGTSYAVKSNAPKIKFSVNERNKRTWKTINEQPRINNCYLLSARLIRIHSKQM